MKTKKTIVGYLLSVILGIVIGFLLAVMGMVKMVNDGDIKFIKDKK